MTDTEAIEAVMKWLDNPQRTQAELHVLCAQIKRTNPKAYAYAILLKQTQELMK